MEITKYVHSCLLVEHSDKRILIDPGDYTAGSRTLDPKAIDRLDYLLITHEHLDHMYPPLIKEFLERFPGLPILTNTSAKDALAKEGIESTTDNPDFVKAEIVPHERVFGSQPPMNVLFKIGNYLTHPGDSLSFSSTTSVLALPLQAPWCSLTQAVEFAVKLKPEVIIPIHDWHWNETARQAFYKRLEGYFAQQKIKFIGLKTAEKVSI